MPSSASFLSLGMSFYWGTRKLLNVFYFTQTGIRRKQEVSHGIVEITVMFGYLKKKKHPTLCSMIGVRR